MNEEYKGFIIKPDPIFDKNTSQWFISIRIEKHMGNYTIDKPYTTNNSFNTKSEAEKQSVRFGKSIIDGDQSELSTPDS